MRTTLYVTLIVFVSKALGFVRDMVQMNYFGTTVQSDAYVNAYGIYFIPVLLLTSCIASTMVPLFLDADKYGDSRQSNLFGSRCINLFAVLSMALSALMYVFAEPLVKLIYPKLSAESIRLTVEMTRIMMPSLVFVTVSIVQATIMNARERFLAGQLSGFPYSIVTIVAAVCFSAPFGIKAVAWATALAGFLQMLIVIPFQRGAFSYVPKFTFWDARVKQVILLAVPSMASMAVNELNHMIDRSFASGMNVGDVSAMSAAYRLITFVLGVAIVPITTVMFSRMSKRAIEKDLKSIGDILTQCIEVIFLVLLPVVVLGMIYDLDIIKFAYMRGKFTLESARNTAWILSMYLTGTIFYGLRDLFNRGFHSLKNTKVPLYNSMITVVLNVILSAIFSRFMGAGGLALATSIASAFGCVVLFVRLKNRVGQMDLRTTGRELLKMGFAALMVMALGMELNRLVPEATGAMQSLMRLVVCGAPCLVLYVVALALLGVRQLSFFKGLLKR